jgi:hypothetical protein
MDDIIRMALEALEQSQTKAPFGADGVVYSKGVKIHEAAITALRTAIAEAEKQEPCGWQFYQNGEWNNGMETNNHRENTEAAGISTRNVYPAAQPEPMRLYVEDFARRCGWKKDSGEGAFEYVQRKSYAQGLEDATPPAAQQRQWVGLTNKEKRHIVMTSDTPSCGVMNAEAKLKEKNT